MTLFPTIKPEDIQANSKGPAQWGAYAYFPASGPRDKTCGDCRFYNVKPGRKRVMICAKYATLMGVKPSAAPSIKADVACKYFQPVGTGEHD